MNDPRYRLSEHVTCRMTNANLRMLFDRERGVMYELNETASGILSVLERAPSSLAEIVTALEEEFDAEQEQIQVDVRQFLSDFSKAGLVLPAQEREETRP